MGEFFLFCSWILFAGSQCFRILSVLATSLYRKPFFNLASIVDLWLRSWFWSDCKFLKSFSAPPFDRSLVEAYYMLNFALCVPKTHPENSLKYGFFCSPKFSAKVYLCDGECLRFFGNACVEQISRYVTEDQLEGVFVGFLKSAFSKNPRLQTLTILACATSPHEGRKFSPKSQSKSHSPKALLSAHLLPVVVISMGKPRGCPGPPHLILRATGPPPEKSYVTYVPQIFVAHLRLL